MARTEARREEEEKKKQEEEKQKPEASSRNAKRQMVSASLTEDSCFWARVEEAIISCNLLKNGGSISAADKEAHMNKLKVFDVYVWDALKNYAVSPEIFLGKSSFMQWWKDYEGIIANPLSSFSQFMVNRTYLKYGIEDLVFA